MTPDTALTATTITLAALVTLAIAAGVLVLVVRARREIRAAERSARYRLAAAHSHVTALPSAAARVRPTAALGALSGPSNGS